jgi:hypothetical protein
MRRATGQGQGMSTLTLTREKITPALARYIVKHSGQPVSVEVHPINWVFRAFGFCPLSNRPERTQQ